jgi:predicted DNA-binding ribbon-helix-helix protein
MYEKKSARTRTKFSTSLNQNLSDILCVCFACVVDSRTTEFQLSQFMRVYCMRYEFVCLYEAGSQE